MKYLDFFEEVFYINLDYRTDRKEHFEKECKKIDLTPIRFPGIIPDEKDIIIPDYLNNKERGDQKYKVGCTLSHQSIIKKAKDLNLNNVLIFEDDCVFINEFKFDNCIISFKEQLLLYIKEIEENNIEWDIFYLGGEPNTDGIKITENIYTVKNGGFYTTHSYAVNKRYFNNILNFDKNNLIDIHYIHDNNKVIFGKNLLTYQYDSYSDLWGVLKTNIKNNTIKEWEKFIK